VNVCAPNRPLPLTEDGVPIPETEASHTQLGIKGSKRNPGKKHPQAREFDRNGKPVIMKSLILAKSKNGEIVNLNKLYHVSHTYQYYQDPNNLKQKFYDTKSIGFFFRKNLL
jgi:hypothetical protein